MELKRNSLTSKILLTAENEGCCSKFSPGYCRKAMNVTSGISYRFNLFPHA
jgi:hypothetical protein